MSAAAEVDLEAPVKTFLTNAFMTTCYGEPTWGTKLTIAFSIGGKTFHTVLQIGRRMLKYPPPRWRGDKEKGVPRLFFPTFVGKYDDPESLHKPSSCIYFETNCVGAPALPVPTSQIHADDPAEKKCFDPPLTKTTIPDGYTQTDILQVFLTKLKLLQTPDVYLLDAAKIRKMGYEEPTYLSVWRLLQGQKSVYEKYGYLSSIYSRAYFDSMMSHRQPAYLALIGEDAIGHERTFDIVRRLVTTRKLKDFKVNDYYYEIKAKLDWHYNTYFAKEGGIAVFEEKPVAELVSKIPYDRTSYQIRWGESSMIPILEALFILILGLSFEYVGKLTLDADSAEWRKWDRELQFLSAEPFVERVVTAPALGTGTGAGASAGAGAIAVPFGGRRRTQRRRRSQQSKKRRTHK